MTQFQTINTKAGAFVKKVSRAQKNRDGENDFNEYFGALYGERWETLKQSLRVEGPKENLHNPFSSGLQGYALDPASLVPVRHLRAEAGQSIADFCASPGGKLIASIFALKGEAYWFSNDLSSARVARLKAVLHDCVPSAVLSRIKVFHGDASRWAFKFRESFDRILVDAPCSGERHLLNSPKELGRWSLTGSKRLAVRQNALLCAAIDCVKPGGRVVYSTCSISDVENDGVIERLLKSRMDQFEIIPVLGETSGEATRHGWILLPDRAGCGPIYFSVLRKKAAVSN